MAKPNATVAHEWYHNHDEHGSGKGSSFFWEGDVIYSFGHHYPIARKVDGEQRVVLFQYLNDWGGYTARHINHVTHAMWGTPVKIYHVEDVGACTPRAHLDNHNNYYDRLRKLGDLFPQARDRKPHIAAWLDELASEANSYAIEFDVPTVRNLTHFDFLPRNWPEEVAAMKVRAAEADVRREEKRKREAELQRETYEKRIIAWRSGENVSLPYMYNTKAVLRYNAKRGVVETSQKANFPVKFAALAWKVIQRCRRKQEGWKRNGQRVPLGVYTLDEVDAYGNMKAGCHRVEYEECQRLAITLGLEESPLELVANNNT